MKKLSVIIPVYNGEDRIQKCIEILENNNYNELIEIIVVNDGSCDSTINILNSQTEKYGNLIIIDNKRNIGVSASRNKALNASNAEYICFCDHDDEFEDGLIDKIIEELIRTSLDLYVFNRIDVQYNTIIAEYKYFNPNVDDYVNSSFPLAVPTWSVCNKVYKKKIIDERNVLFAPEIRMSEDLLFNLKYNVHIKNIGIINGNYIRYCNAGSAVYHKNPSFFFTNIEFKKYMDFELNDNIINLVESNMAYVSIWRLINNIDCNNYKDFRKTIKKINKYLKSNKIFIINGYGISKYVIKIGLFFNQYLIMYFILNKLRNLKNLKNLNKLK